MPAHSGRGGRDRHLAAAGAQHGPAVGVSEEAVRGALHVQHVLGMSADAAENAEHRLHEERRLHELTVQKVREVVEVARIVTLELKAGAMPCKSPHRKFDVLEGVS